jgi:hypothetical protein
LITRAYVLTTGLLLIVFLSSLTPVKSQNWGNPSAAYLQVNSVNLNGSGSQISVGPGDTVTGTISYQFWDNGNPTAIWQIWALLGYGNPSDCLWSGVPGGQPGVSRTDSWTFSAPQQAGTYSVLIMPIALFHCGDLASNPQQNWPSEVAVGQIAVSSPQTPTCSGGQIWNGAQCVCPSGQQWNGYQCVTTPPPTPNCPGGQYWNGAQCVCPPGQQWNGYQCVAPPQQPQMQVRFANVLDQAQDIPGLVILILQKVSPMDDIVWVYTRNPNLRDLSIDYSPSYLLTQIYKNRYDDSPARWAFELKSPILKDALQEVLLTITVVGICFASQILPPPIDLAGLQACAAYVQANRIMKIPGLIKDLASIYALIAPVVTLDSATLTDSGGQSVIRSSQLNIEGGSPQLPTLKDVLDHIAATHQTAQIVSVDSPVQLMIIDSQGRRLGEDANGQIVDEIPNAFFLGPDAGHLAYLPSDLAGYKVQLTGTGTGNYGLTITYLSGSPTQQTVEGSISQGQSVEYDVSSSSQNVNIVSAQPRWSWTNFGLAAVVTIVLVLASSEVILRRRRGRGR